MAPACSRQEVGAEIGQNRGNPYRILWGWHRKWPKTVPPQLIKPVSAPNLGNIDSEIRRSREGVVEGGTEIGFSGYGTKNNFRPPERED
jgi:hypothetical protein